MGDEEANKRQKLSNQDFRKLIQETKPAAAAKPAQPQDKPAKKKEESERKKRKKEYAKYVEEKKEQEAILAAKYRDRAAERREGKNVDYEDTAELLQTTQQGDQIAPFAEDAGVDQRRKEIEASKYLGGDIEHTHLVKGLDFALLEKVKSEINNPKEADEDKRKADGEKPEEIKFKTRMARSVHELLFSNTTQKQTEMFQPGRQLYVVDLAENGESDIPTTILRSKAEAGGLKKSQRISTNDIVINKLMQILSYLRQGLTPGVALKTKKEKKEKKTKTSKSLVAKKPTGENEDDDFDMFQGVGDYVPREAKETKSEPRAGGTKSYFSNAADEDSKEEATAEAVGKPIPGPSKPAPGADRPPPGAQRPPPAGAERPPPGAQRGPPGAERPPPGPSRPPPGPARPPPGAARPPVEEEPKELSATEKKEAEQLRAVISAKSIAQDVMATMEKMNPSMSRAKRKGDDDSDDEDDIDGLSRAEKIRKRLDQAESYGEYFPEGLGMIGGDDSDDDGDTAAKAAPDDAEEKGGEKKEGGTRKERRKQQQLTKEQKAASEWNQIGKIWEKKEKATTKETKKDE